MDTLRQLFTRLEYQELIDLERMCSSDFVDLPVPLFKLVNRLRVLILHRFSYFLEFSGTLMGELEWLILLNVVIEVHSFHPCRVMVCCVLTAVHLSHIQASSVEVETKSHPALIDDRSILLQLKRVNGLSFTKSHIINIQNH